MYAPTSRFPTWSASSVAEPMVIRVPRSLVAACEIPLSRHRSSRMRDALAWASSSYFRCVPMSCSLPWTITPSDIPDSTPLVERAPPPSPCEAGVYVTGAWCTKPDTMRWRPSRKQAFVSKSLDRGWSVSSASQGCRSVVPVRSSRRTSSDHQAW